MRALMTYAQWGTAVDLAGDRAKEDLWLRLDRKGDFSNATRRLEFELVIFVLPPTPSSQA